MKTLARLARLAVAACLAAGAPSWALEETAAHSILKHELIDTIVFREKPTRVVDLFGGTIVYRDGRGVEIGTAGRIIMNGHAPSYYVNDQQYERPGATCRASGLHDQQRAVDVHVTASTLPFDKSNASVFVNAALEYLRGLPALGHGETQVIIIDPYFYMPEDAVRLLLRGTDASTTRLLIYSPRNRLRERPFPSPACQGQVYSETDERFRILTNKDGNPLTYTVAGCRISTWTEAVADAIKVFSKTTRAERDGTVLIKASQVPLDFHAHLPGAEKIQSCIVKGVDPFSADAGR